MKKFLILGALVAGLAFLGTARTAEAGHRHGRDSYRSRGYSYGYYAPSYGYYSPSYGYYSYSPEWSYYRHGGYYSPYRRHYRDYGYRRSGFDLYIGNGSFGFSILRSRR